MRSVVQRWIQLHSMPQTDLQERGTLEQEIRRRTQNQRDDRSQLLQVQEQPIRTQRALLGLGVIEESNSSWSSPVTLVQKRLKIDFASMRVK